MLAEVTTYYLEMCSPRALRPKRVALEGLLLMKAEIPSAEPQHFLYRSVGGNWYWYEKPTGATRLGGNTPKTPTCIPGCST